MSQQQQQPSTDGYPPLDNPSVDKNVHHQQPPITNYPPGWNHNNNNYPTATTATYYNPMMNDQQQPPVVQNYPTATTSNYNPMMMNQQQQPPVQNYQPASTTNAAVGSNFFMGNPASNGLPVYTKTVAVIGSQYCSPNPFDIIITRKMLHLSSGNFIVEDVNGNLLFKVKDGIQLLRDRRVLLDAEGKPVVTMQEKIMTAHNRWNVFKGDSREQKDLLFCVKETSIIQLRTKLDVFLASNGNEGIGDFSLKGSWGERSCMIYGGDAKTIIAQMHKKVTVGSVLVGKDKFTVTVYPNIDCAFIVALLVILDDINRQLV